MKQFMSTKKASAMSGRVSMAVRACTRLRCSAGFTMIELMIVVAIIAILTAIAYPSYITYITKTHRVAAEGCLSEYANYMERYYTTNLNYLSASDGTANPLSTSPPTLTLDCASTQQTGDNYSYDLASSSTTSYQAEAVPIGAQASRDTTCGTLKLDQTGARTTSTGATTCW